MMAKNLLAFCTSPNESPNHVVCEVFVEGAMEVLAHLSRINHVDTGVCLPDDVNLDEAVAAATANLRDLASTSIGPDRSAVDVALAGSAVLGALAMKWPCH
jgi:hypothetical protein